MIKRDINQINDDIKVISSSSIVLMCVLLFLMLSIVLWLFAGTVTEKANIRGVVFPDSGMNDVCLPQPGVVRSMFVQKGQEVSVGQRIALVSVGDSYSVVTSNDNGVIFSVKQENETFEAFEPIVSMVDDPKNTRRVRLIAYSDLMNLKDIAAGQSVRVWPSNEKMDEIGYVRGRVMRVSRYPVDKAEVSKKIKTKGYINELLPENVPYYEVDVEIGANPDNPTLLDWTFNKGEHPDMSVGTLCNAIVITHTYSIFEYLFLKARTGSNKVRNWLE